MSGKYGERDLSTLFLKFNWRIFCQFCCKVSTDCYFYFFSHSFFLTARMTCQLTQELAGHSWLTIRLTEWAVSILISWPVWLAWMFFCTIYPEGLESWNLYYRVSPDLPLDPSSQPQQRSNGGAADPNGNVTNGGGDTDILLERIAALQQVGSNFRAFPWLYIQWILYVQEVVTDFI